MTLEFSTKAGTLALLKDKLESAKIAPIAAFKVAEWKADPRACVESLKSGPVSFPVIVRSSCALEDTRESSNAGAFLSIANVDEMSLVGAVEQVIESYGTGGNDSADEVLIQPMLADVQASGVAFSHDPNTCSPYRVINWSEGSETDVVTAGLGGNTWFQAASSPVEVPSQLKGVISLIDELLALFGEQPVDLEFATTGPEHTLWLLQARPLVLLRASESEAKQTARLKHIHTKIAQGLADHPFLLGKRSVYGVMPDWNPAEMIGVRPRPLAISLYRDLITDSIWAYQRDNYGYRNLRSFPLMAHFFGLPYIDTRISFNSFIPADLDEGVATRLVDHYIDRLLEQPALHDKVEFEIVFSCYTLDLPERLERLSSVGFTEDEQGAIADSLRRLTNRIIHPETGLWRSDADKLEVLQSRRSELLASNADPVERIYWLLEDAKRYGTLPFAGLARAGFVAVQMLRSLVSVGVFEQSDYDAFMSGVNTVGSQLANDRRELSKDAFLERYGHLRPGTYDILSPRYDETPDSYFDWSKKPEATPERAPFALTLPQMRKLTQLLTQHGLNADPVQLLDFLQAGIELRELAKFHFSRNLSDILNLIAGLGESSGISREDMSYCDLSAVKELYVAAVDPRQVLEHSIEQGKARHAETMSTSLPPLITHADDVWGFRWPDSEPNFITQKQVTADVVDSDQRDALAGAVVCIPNADPGYDWLFSYPIAGLITAWGGANSHMAIRAGELELPAIIGAGEVLFRQWSSARRLHIDCSGRRVEVLA